MYIQKPFNVGTSFIQIFKVCYIIEIFLVVFRTLKLKSRNLNIVRDLKNKLHHVSEISSYKIVNFRMHKKNKKLLFFCNIAMRSLMFPILPLLFNYKYLMECLKKKLKQFKYNFLLLNYRNYIFYFLKKLKQNRLMNLKNSKLFISKIKLKFKSLNSLYLLKYNKEVIFKNKYCLKEHETLEWNRWFYDT